MAQTAVIKEKKSGFIRFLDAVERVGNALPHPFMLFFYLALAVVALSFIFGELLGVSVINPITNELVAVRNLASKDGIQFMLTSMLSNFTGFRPLGYVLGMVLAIGLAEKVGLMEVFLKNVISKSPAKLVTYVVIAVGVLGHTMSEASFIIIPPLAAMVFQSVGRHPVAGLIAGFSSVGAGYGANILIANIDVLLSGISTEIVQSIDPSITVLPLDNYYFSAAGFFMIVILGVFVNNRIIEPKLGKYEGGYVAANSSEITDLERKGLRISGIWTLACIAIIVAAFLIPNSPFKDANGTIKPFLNSIVPILMILFLTAGISYGVITKKIKTSADVPKFMGESIKDMAGYIVLVFAVAQFIAYFDWTNLSMAIAVKSSAAMEAMNLTGLGAFIAFILLVGICNLFIASGSAQWALLGPVFLPMFMMLGYEPAFIQVAYRIGDAATNIITPLNVYMIVVLAYMKNYDVKAGLGTLMSLTLPYSLIFLAAWIIMFSVFFLLGIPVGPGIDMYWQM